MVYRGDASKTKINQRKLDVANRKSSKNCFIVGKGLFGAFMGIIDSITMVGNISNKHFKNKNIGYVDITIDAVTYDKLVRNPGWKYTEKGITLQYQVNGTFLIWGIKSHYPMRVIRDENLKETIK